MSNHGIQPLQNLGNIPTYKAGVVQSSAHRRLRKFTEDCIKDHGITMMQWFIIGTIYDTGPTGIGVTELSKAVDTNVPYITNTLNLLEHKQIIERETREGDNRSKVVRITASYLPQIKHIEADMRRKMRKTIYASVTPAELRAYLTVLYKLNHALARYQFR